jgi:CheY-like chemotaxis protein
MSENTGKRLLYVEDDAWDVELLQRAFEVYGFDARVETAPDGQAALDLLRGGQPPDLVLTDIKMPRVNGLELQEKIRADARLHALRVAVLTSSAEKGDRERALAHGALAFLQKPMELEAWKPVIETLRALLAG